MSNYYKSYKKTFKWHILVDIIILIGMIISASWIFHKRALFHIYFTIIIGVIAFIHGLIILVYFFGFLFEKKWWTVLGAILHLATLVLFIILSYTLLVLQVGAPSVGD